MSERENLERLGLRRDSDGTLAFSEKREASLGHTVFHSVYNEAAVRYANIFDRVFARALRTSEFELVNVLIRVRAMEDPGWDPWETTKKTVKAARDTVSLASTFEAERTLQLWLYGHIVEASEPYEILMNLARVIVGERYNFLCFPPKKRGRLPGPGEKIDKIKTIAHVAGVPQLVVPLKETWDRVLRNAVFHSEYSLHGYEVRIRRPLRVLSQEEFMTKLNRALALHDSLSVIETLYRRSFDRPRLVSVHPQFEKWPGEQAWVMVREGYGAIGLRDALSPEEISAGRIPWSIGKFFEHEARQLHGSSRPVFFSKEPPAPFWATKRTRIK